MKISFAEPEQPRSGAVVVGVWEEGVLTPAAGHLDEATSGAISRALSAAPRFSGKKDELLPWFVEYTRVKGQEETFIKLEGLDTKEAARRMVQKEVWVPEEDVAAFAGKAAPISLVGFRLFDGKEDLGEILEVIEQPHQVLCRIDLGGKEALIPMHAETLLRVDARRREVHVALPDGLLDVYR